MNRAATIDTFAPFASLGAANLPLVLAIADRERLLCDGQAVSMFSAGAGETCSSVVLRWGRG